MPTLTFNPIADTFIDEGNPSQNWGDNQYFIVDAQGDPRISRHGLMRFDLNGLPAGAVITAAKLRFYWTPTVVEEESFIRVHKCLRLWEEMEATWEDYSEGNAWSNPGGIGAGEDWDEDFDSTIYTGFTFPSDATAGWYESDDFIHTDPGGEIGIQLTVADLENLIFFPWGLHPGDQFAAWMWSQDGSGYIGYEPQLIVTYTEPSGIGWKPGSRKFRFSPCGGYYPCCGYYYCYGSYHCCPCQYFSYGGLAPCCQWATLSGFTGDYEFLNRTWRLAQCTVPEPDGTYCYQFHCPSCTWRATYCTPTGTEETRCINLRIWNDGTPESPAYKARLTVEGSTFEKDLGATKPSILDDVGTMTRTGGEEGAATVTAELEDGECGNGECVNGCKCGLAPEEFSVTITGVANNTCSECAAFDGTFILKRRPVSPFDDAWCFWVYDFSNDSICSESPWAVQLEVSRIDPGFLIVTIGIREGFLLYRRFEFLKSYDPPIVPCLALKDESIPFYASDISYCLTGSATCKVTAL